VYLQQQRSKVEQEEEGRTVVSLPWKLVDKDLELTNRVILQHSASTSCTEYIFVQEPWWVWVFFLMLLNPSVIVKNINKHLEPKIGKLFSKPKETPNWSKCHAGPNSAQSSLNRTLDRQTDPCLRQWVSPPSLGKLGNVIIAHSCCRRQQTRLTICSDDL